MAEARASPGAPGASAGAGAGPGTGSAFPGGDQMGGHGAASNQRPPLLVPGPSRLCSVYTKVHSACLSPSPRPHWPSVPTFQGLSLNIPPLLPQALVLVQPPRLGWGSLHTHKLMGLPCQHTQPTKFPSAWACPVGRQVMSYSSLNFPHLRNGRDRPGSHVGTLRKVLLQKTGKGHCWLRAQPKQR